ncbi:hypothetical protein ERJ72_19365 [Bacillus thuringiensis]|nr:hypothetical protein [Bacillus thuringiensis]QFP90164.1 hypothetical protein F9800_24875 [Bacillus thuringiensis]
MRTMEEQIFNSMIQQGAFAALFVWMLFTTQKRMNSAKNNIKKLLKKINRSLKNKQKHLVRCQRIYQMLSKKYWETGMRNKI